MHAGAIKSIRADMEREYHSQRREIEKHERDLLPRLSQALSAVSGTKYIPKMQRIYIGSYYSSFGDDFVSRNTRIQQLHIDVPILERIARTASEIHMYEDMI